MKKKFLHAIQSLVLLTGLACIRSTDCSIAHTLTKRQICDLELILNGGFAPLKGFLNQTDYDSVVEKMRLADGTLWPMPITLDVSESMVKNLAKNSALELRTPEGILLATMQVSDWWVPNKMKEAVQVYGTTDLAHPGVDYLVNQTKEYYVGGEVSFVSLPKYYDFVELRKTPADLKKYFKEMGYTKVVAFQTRNPMHRAHVELTQRAAQSTQAHLLLHPVVGLTKPGDIDHFTRVHCYKKLLKYYPQESTTQESSTRESATLSLLPISMRMAGPREALWHAIIRKNYGCTHFIIGRDHAGPGNDSQGIPFYEPYAAQNFVQEYAEEIGIEFVPFKEMVYLPDLQIYQAIDEISPDTKTWTISGTQLRSLLRNGQAIPEWFSYPEVIEELRKVYPPKLKQGITIAFTGLSGSGKSTLANALAIKLTELQDRSVTILDGDVARTYLSSELGFSKEHRSLHVRRVGFVSSEISKNSGIAICALISPYEQDRNHNRTLISARAGYIEVYVSTPLSECEKRDVKGLYAKARAGIVKNFTGITDPYEVPVNPEITIDTSTMSVEQALEIITSYLKKEGYIH